MIDFGSWLTFTCWCGLFVTVFSYQYVMLIIPEAFYL